MSRATSLNRTRGILLAGTHPWNSAFDSLVPRTLLPIANRPLIAYGLSWLSREGIREVSVCVNRETRALPTLLAPSVPHGMLLSYHEDPMPRGAAGSAADAALATDAQTFVVADATTIPNIDLSALLAQHRASHACVTIVVHSEARRHGSPMQSPSGIYVFERRAFEEVATRGFCDLKEGLIPRLHAAGERIDVFEVPVAAPRVLDASTYLAVNAWMVEHFVESGEEIEGYIRSGDGFVHRDAFIAGDAAIVGPVLVGAGARVLSGAVVVGPTTIGREATLSDGVMVSRSAVWRRAFIGEQAVTDRCIVTDDAIVRAGSQMLRDVVIADNRETDRERRAAEQLLRVPKASMFEVGARLGRLVFGANWSRSTAQ